MSFEGNSNTETMQYTTTPFVEHTSYDREVSNFFDQLNLDRAQDLGNIIMWWDESFGEFRGKSNL